MRGAWPHAGRDETGTWNQTHFYTWVFQTRSTGIFCGSLILLQFKRMCLFRQWKILKFGGAYRQPSAKQVNWKLWGFKAFSTLNIWICWLQPNHVCNSIRKLIPCLINPCHVLWKLVRWKDLPLLSTSLCKSLLKQYFYLETSHFFLSGHSDFWFRKILASLPTWSLNINFPGSFLISSWPAVYPPDRNT